MSELEYLGEYLLFYSLLQMKKEREVWKVLQLVMEGEFEDFLNVCLFNQLNSTNKLMVYQENWNYLPGHQGK